MTLIVIYMIETDFVLDLLVVSHKVKNLMEIYKQTIEALLHMLEIYNNQVHLHLDHQDHHQDQVLVQVLDPAQVPLLALH